MNHAMAALAGGITCASSPLPWVPRRRLPHRGWPAQPAGQLLTVLLVFALVRALRLGFATT
jgi:hypothetical protein